MDYGKYIVFTVALVGLIGVGILLFSETSDSTGQAYVLEEAKIINDIDPPAEVGYEEAIMIADIDPASATITASNTKVEISEIVTFTVVPQNGVMPYHDATLYCGNGKTVSMDNVGTGLREIYRAQCRYDNKGKYEAYAILYDSTTAISARDPSGTRILTDNLLIIVSAPNVIIPYATIQVSDTNIREDESINVDLTINYAVSPYEITIYCGQYDITRSDYTSNTLTVECEYDDDGLYTVYAEIFDSTNYRILSNVVDVNVDRRSGSGGGSSGGSSGGSGGGVGACFPSWKCTAWSECINNVQTRKCTDIYNCDSTYKKPSETLECISINEAGSINVEDNTNQGVEVTENITEPEFGEQGFNWTPFIIITVLVVLILVYFIIVYPERKKYTAYINKLTGVVGDARNKGYSDDTIKAGLISQGHKHRHIKKALKK